MAQDYEHYESVDEKSPEVSREFHDFIADIEDLIRTATSMTAEELQNSSAKLRVRLANLKTSVEQVSDSFASRVKETACSTNTYAHQQPWVMVLASAFFGFGLGLGLNRRSRTHKNKKQLQ